MIHAFLSPSRPVRLALATLVCATTACAAKIEVSTVFEYGNSDPYDRANLYGFNHAPNVTVAPDGSLIAAWFSGAHEGDIHQLILQAKSADGGKSCHACTHDQHLGRGYLARRCHLTGEEAAEVVAGLDHRAIARDVRRANRISMRRFS